MAAAEPIQMPDDQIPRLPPPLPLEIYQSIILNLAGADQKNVRLSWRELAIITEPILFRQVTLVPSWECLQAFVNVFVQSQVVRHVVELVYDDRWMATVDAIRKQVSESEEHLAERKMETVKQIDRFKESYFVLKDDDAVELAVLSRIFQLLSLDSLVIHDIQREGDLDMNEMPTCVRRVCEGPVDLSSFKAVLSHQRRGRDYSRVPSALIGLMCVGARTQRLKATNLSWYSFVRNSGGHAKQKKSMQSVLASVGELDLTWREERFYTAGLSADYLGRVHELIRAAQHLRKLSLCMHSRSLAEIETEIGYEDSYVEPLILGPDYIRFKHLVHLNLGSIVCYQHELERLFKTVNNLRILELRDILLIRESADMPRGCMFKVIMAIATHLDRLERIMFGGYLTNGGRQLWYPHDVPTEWAQALVRQSLRNRIDAYVTGKSSTIPGELLRNAITPPNHDVVKPSTKHPWVKGDCTWSITQRTTPPGDQRFSTDDDSEDEGQTSPAPPSNFNDSILDLLIGPSDQAPISIDDIVIEEEIQSAESSDDVDMDEDEELLTIGKSLGEMLAGLTDNDADATMFGGDSCDANVEPEAEGTGSQVQTSHDVDNHALDIPMMNGSAGIPNGHALPGPITNGTTDLINKAGHAIPASDTSVDDASTTTNQSSHTTPLAFKSPHSNIASTDSENATSSPPTQNNNPLTPYTSHALPAPAEKDIELVTTQASVDRQRAVQALKQHYNDPLGAIKALGAGNVG